MTTTAAGSARDVLHRAEGVQLLGEMAGSGYRVPPSLVRRADGQTIQLTPLLYAVLQEIDGRRTPAEVARAVSSSTGRTVSEDNIRHLVDQQLRPLGLLTLANGAEPELRRQNPLLGLRLRYTVTDPARTRRLTDPFRVLFRSFMVVPLLAAFALVCWWVLFEKGLASATYEAFERPELLILVFAVTVLSAGFHEFGHAAAARYGGATPGVMGFGMYLVWPAFYTDVTDSYRLGRGGRLRTDLGGLYFNAIVAVAITGVWLWLRYDALLLVVATQILQMLRQLTPLVRFDGYHVLADLTGVPDLYARIKPTLLGALPWRWGDPEARLLKPWARVVVTAWVLVVVPLLLGALVVMVLALPRLMGTAWAALGKQQDVLATAWSEGDLVQVTARLLAMVAIVVPVAGIVYMLSRLVRQTATGAWRATTGKPAKRALAAVLAGTLIAGVAWAWWPGEDSYEPIQPWERGTVMDGLALAGVTQATGPAARPPAPTLHEGQRGVIDAVWDSTAPQPTRERPQLAVVLVPKGADPADPEAVAAGWVFPFDHPLAPGPGDNQALAINTEDGTVLYDVAFALVWVEDGQDALNRNEAQAWASCDTCAAVAIAFQVVFVVGDADAPNVAAPQNVAGALNYDCVNCLTYALARQLFVRLDEPLSRAAMRELETLWAEIGRYSRDIQAGKVALDEIAGRLAGYKEQILAIVAEDQGDKKNAPESTPPSATSSPSPSASQSEPPTPTASGTSPTSPPETGTATSSEAPESPTPSPGSASASPTTSPTAGTQTATPTG
ncbi:hypothetical protein [Nocardioides pakistanensis]